MRLWRIGNALFPVWSAEGARLKGGRWNQPGTPAIYAATSFASCALEALVHSNVGRLPRNARYVTIDIPDDAPVGRLNAEEVAGWNEIPARASRVAGDPWIRARSGLVLLVPSAVTLGLDDYAVINPLHPDYARIVVSEEAPVRWDERLFVSR
jgi:RES domain-containing protein